MFRGLYYGSYKAPREMIWILGVILYILMMATAFLGYTLPWGQMSFWGATVITNFFSAFDALIPGLGTAIVTWLWGGFGVDNATLHRFFSLHYLLPFVIAGVVVLHIWALHVPGNNNPLGIDVKGPAGHGALPSLLHGEGPVLSRLLSDPLRLFRVLQSEPRWATRSITRRPIRSRRRKTSCRNGISCPSTRSSDRSRTS